MSNFIKAKNGEAINLDYVSDIRIEQPFVNGYYSVTAYIDGKGVEISREYSEKQAKEFIEKEILKNDK